MHPSNVIAAATKGLTINPRELFKLKEELMHAATTRSQTIFASVTKELSEGKQKALIDNLLTDKRLMFYCCTGEDYVGLGRNSCKDVNELVKAYFKEKLSIAQFLVAVNEFSSVLQRRSQCCFEPLYADLQVYLDDNRMIEVINNC